MSQSAELERLVELLDSFSHAMLVTLRGDELRSRPMAIADVTDRGKVRFITRDDSAKLEELDRHSEVNVALQGEGRFLSLSGRARLTKDAQLKRLVQDHAKSLWFSSGPDDPHLMVLEVVPTHAEYWDQRAGNVVETVLERAKSALGTDAGAAAGEHGEIDFTQQKP